MKTRMVYTKVWDKDNFNAFSKDAKLLFMHLITNQRINVCGAYEMSDRIIISETGLKANELEKAKKELFPKVIFFEGWVYVKNAMKYYKGKTNEKAKENELAALPESIRKCFIDGVCSIEIPHASPTDTPSENREVMLVKDNLWKDMTPAQQMTAFVENESKVFEGQGAPVQEIVKQWLMAKWKIDEKKALFEMGKFISYWTEPTKNGKKQRWQTQETFEIKRRFVTWMTNNYGKGTETINNNKYQVEGL